MSAPLKVSADLAAIVARMRERPEPVVLQTIPAARGPVAIGLTANRAFSRFTPRQRPTSPNRRASLERRRKLGGSGVLPECLRHHYTLGQMAVLAIIAGEVKHHGICDLPIDKIAALAGVCRTAALRKMKDSQKQYLWQPAVAADRSLIARPPGRCRAGFCCPNRH